LQCVFHGIRFKVNKRLGFSGIPFFVPIRLAFVAEWAFKSGKKSTQYNYVRPLDGAWSRCGGLV